MKKMYFVLSFVMISAMLLSACTGATSDPNGQVATQDAGETGGLADSTATTDAGAGGTGADTTPTTDAAGGVADSTPTVDAGAGAGAADTPEGERTPTLASGTGPGAPSTPEGGRASDATFVLLSDLVTGRVETGDREQVGSIAGVVVSRPIAVTGAGADTGAQATPTSDIGKGAVTGSTDSGASLADAGPRISHVLVNLTGEEDATGSTGEAGQATATPGTGGSDGSGAAVGNAVAVPWEAFVLNASDPVDAQAGTDRGTFALVLGVDPAVLAGAPTFTNEQSIAQGWDADAQAYWSNQGLSIPATGPAEAEGEPVVIRGTMDTMNVTSQDGQNFGQVSDFVVDLTTGELAYAILSGAGTDAGAGTGSFYAVPVTNFNWSAGADASMGGTGEFSANFPQTAFDSAPSFTSLEELDFSADWNSEIDTYWQSAGGNNQ